MADFSESESEFEGFESNFEAAYRNAEDVPYPETVQDLDSDIELSDIEDTETSDDDNFDREYETDTEDDNVRFAHFGRWTGNLHPFSLSDFSGPESGAVTILDAGNKELDFLYLIFNENIFSEIATQTNLYAQKCIATKPNPGWYATDREEIIAFFGCMVVMGVIPAPAQDMYWYKDKLFHPSCIEHKFPRTRFENIQRYLHVADTSTNPARGQEGHDKLAHVRPILELTRASMLAQYHQHKEVSIDEAMVGYSGRLGFKQYVPLKPTKRGIKVWVRADPYNGYVNDFQVYTGRVGNTPETNLGARVVLDLMRPILDLGHHLYCDSFFTSPDLFLQLRDRETYACGTVRLNSKGLPPDLKTIKLKTQGDSVEKQKGDMRAILWRDKKPQNILSTNTDGPHDVVQRKQ